MEKMSVSLVTIECRKIAIKLQEICVQNARNLHSKCTKFASKCRKFAFKAQFLSLVRSKIPILTLVCHHFALKLQEFSLQMQENFFKCSSCISALFPAFQLQKFLQSHQHIFTKVSHIFTNVFSHVCF